MTSWAQARGTASVKQCNALRAMSRKLGIHDHLLGELKALGYSDFSELPMFMASKYLDEMSKRLDALKTQEAQARKDKWAREVESLKAHEAKRLETLKRWEEIEKRRGEVSS